MKKFLIPFLFVMMPLILSCWNSSPTSNNTKTYKVNGVVADKNGNGISGVAINISGKAFSTADTTDSEGIFTLEGIKSGNYNVKAHKDSCFFKPANNEIKIGKSDIDTLRFTSADNFIHGNILDIMTDKGIAGVKVVISKEIYNGTEITGYVDSTITDNNGEYGFFDIEIYNYTINFKTDSNRQLFYKLISQEFVSPEIIIPIYYSSSEKLEITTAKFSKDTKTLYLEWTPSKSAFVDGYGLYRSNAPFKLDGPYDIKKSMDFYNDNKATIIITPEYVKRFFDVTDSTGIMYFAVSASYHKGKVNNYFSNCESPVSNDVNLRLYW
jgi:hypothetical protein